MKNELNEYITDVTKTSASYTITWTTNEPTASTTITIADGTAPTSTELGQAVHDLNTQTNALTADITLILAKLNA